eukprot:1145924-Pelagomonas_calceolata.AAC.1
MRHTGFAPGKRLPSTTKQEQKRRVGIWRIAAPKFLDLAVRSTLVFSCAPSGYNRGVLIITNPTNAQKSGTISRALGVQWNRCVTAFLLVLRRSTRAAGLHLRIVDGAV